jgi:hypothetical protein
MGNVALLPEKRYQVPQPCIKYGSDDGHGLPEGHPSREAPLYQTHHEEVELLLTCIKSSHTDAKSSCNSFIALQKSYAFSGLQH